MTLLTTANVETGGFGMLTTKAAGLAAVPVALGLALTAGCDAGGGTGAVQKKATAPASAPASPTEAANGVERLAPAEILKRAREATAGAPSVRLKGGFKEGGDEVALDFRFAGKKRAAGTMRLGDQNIELTRIGSTVYFKGDDRFLKSIGGRSAVTLMSGKYVKTTSKDPDFAELASFSDLSDLLREMVASAGGGWAKGAAGNVGGVPAVALTGPDGEQVHVATRGRPYLLRLDAGPRNRLDFVEYGGRVDLRPPPPGEVIDAAELG
ncbi:hypothetical protein [Spirillospora sp. NPDC029432]|uniref:hypothetical protein n=1 Tax=Spirillospora sp. NPDC029432 TaxID=3154599 RepID=UPI0034571FB2